MKKSFIPFVLACGAVASSCSAPAGAGEGSSCCNKTCIKGEWNIVSANGLSTDSCERVFVAFQDSNLVNGNTGINSFFGQYAKNGDSLSINMAGGTLMAGPANLMKVEDAVKAALSATATVKVDGDTATAMNANGEAVLVMVKAKQACILGKWNIVEAKGVKADSTANPAFIEFGDSSKVNGCSGVNMFNGEFELNGENIAIKNLGQTKMAAGPFRAVEDAVNTAVASAAKFLVQGKTATLFDANGEAVLIMEKGE